MKLSEFEYELPGELIAQYPCKAREDARLMVVSRRDSTITHRVFRDIGEYLDAGDLLVANDTKVRTCRLSAKRVSGGKVEVLLLGKKSGATFEALLKPARLKLGESVHFSGNGLCAEISGKNEVTFNTDDEQEIYGHGSMPLPPYIKRAPEAQDEFDYQTVYAAHQGSVAAPTAGLHFTQNLLGSLQEKGVKLAYLTLHVGYATFKPVKSQDVQDHGMEYESFSIPEATVEMLTKTHAAGKRVVAVGTTASRALEAFAGGMQEGRTNLFVFPGYTFKMVDCLLTNFHLPHTTLLMLVSAFGGMELTRKAYREAVKEKYRFYSYGDAMLII